MRVGGVGVNSRRQLDVQLVEGPTPLQRPPSRLPAVAPVVVCIYRVTDCAGDVWDKYLDQEVSLWQCQITHAVQRPITFQMRDGFNDFLRAAHADNEQMPTNVRDLEEAAGVRFVLTDREDPDDVGFVQWRVAFYVAGDLNNFLSVDGINRAKYGPGWLILACKKAA